MEEFYYCRLSRAIVKTDVVNFKTQVWKIQKSAVQTRISEWKFCQYFSDNETQNDLQPTFISNFHQQFNLTLDFCEENFQ